MRFKTIRAKKWWQETMVFLNSIRSVHKFQTSNIFDEIEKRNIGPLQLTRISSPETTRTSTRRYHRRTYPISIGCIDFDTDEQLQRMTPSIYDDRLSKETPTKKKL